jgi:hypothetical protein
MTTKRATDEKQGKTTAEQSKTAQKHEEKSSKKAESSESKDSAEALKDLDSLSEALQSDLSEIEPNAAMKMIEHWHSLVQKSKEPELREIASGLKELQKLLKQDDAGHELGELLDHLGKQTSDVASEAKPGLKRPLQHLGKQLSKAGRSLAKKEDQHHLEALDALIDTLSQDPDQLDAKSASEIEQWYTLLHESEDENLQAIASDLNELKQLLKGKKVNSDDLSELLINIGEQTIEASSNANRGFKGTIQMLGKSLTKLGESIE